MVSRVTDEIGGLPGRARHRRRPARPAARRADGRDRAGARAAAARLRPRRMQWPASRRARPIVRLDCPTCRGTRARTPAHEPSRWPAPSGRRRASSAGARHVRADLPVLRPRSRRSVLPCWPPRPDELLDLPAVAAAVGLDQPADLSQHVTSAAIGCWARSRGCRRQIADVSSSTSADSRSCCRPAPRTCGAWRRPGSGAGHERAGRAVPAGRVGADGALLVADQVGNRRPCPALSVAAARALNAVAARALSAVAARAAVLAGCTPCLAVERIGRR